MKRVYKTIFNTNINAFTENICGYEQEEMFISMR